MPPLFFISGPQASTLGVLKSLEDPDVQDLLSDVVDESELAASVLTKGPDGQQGVLLSIPSPGAEVQGFGYKPDNQRWEQATPSLWVGFHGDTWPAPDEMLRLRVPVMSAESVRMEDGSIWEVSHLRDPIVGGVPESVGALHRALLPSSCYRTVRGSWATEVLPRYADLYEESRQWFEWLFNSVEKVGKVDFGYADLFDYAIQVLSLQYRYTTAFHTACKGHYLSTDAVQQVLAVSCGWSLMLKHLDQKKSMTLIRQS